MMWRLYGEFAEDVGAKGIKIVYEPGMTIRDALEDLFAVAPGVRERVIHDGELGEYVHVVHNHTDVYHELDGLDTELAASDELALFRVA